MKTRRSFFQIGALLGLFGSIGAKANKQSQSSRSPDDWPELPLGITRKDIESVTKYGFVLSPLLLELVFEKIGERCPGRVESVPLLRTRWSSLHQHSRLSFKLNNNKEQWLHMEVTKPTQPDDGINEHHFYCFETILVVGETPLSETDFEQSVHRSGHFIMEAKSTKTCYETTGDVKILPIRGNIEIPAEALELMATYMSIQADLKKFGLKIA